MNTRPTPMHLAAFCTQPGNHVAAWRHPLAETDQILSPSFYKSFAQTAERGIFDLIFLADILAVAEVHEPSGSKLAHGVPFRAEPLTTLALMSAVTEHIGLVGTMSTSHNEPFNLARRFAFLDHVSEGRAGWNIVTTASKAEALNFGEDAFHSHSDRYERATEFVDVVRKLWDSWQDDAIVGSKHDGVYADGNKVTPINHSGKYFNVRGPLNVPRPPQGHPVLFQAGASDVGRSFAAAHADAVFLAAQTKAEAQAITGDIRTLAQQHGRDGNDIRFLAGVLAFVGETEEEAREKQATLSSYLLPEVGRALLTELIGIDFSQYSLDEPFPEVDLETVPGIKSRYLLLKSMADRQRLTLRDVMARVASGAGHRIVVGNATQVADELEDWFNAGAVDGYAVMWPYLPGGLEDFVSLVIPELQRRRLTRTAYPGQTLRSTLGLQRVGHP